MGIPYRKNGYNSRFSRIEVVPKQDLPIWEQLLSDLLPEEELLPT